MSYKPEMKVAGDPKFYPNGMAFATEAEALAHGRELASRWTMAEAWRAVASDQPVNYEMVDGRAREIKGIVDILVRDEGSIVVLQAVTVRALSWLREHTQTEEYQWLGNNSLCVESRYAKPIITGADANGLHVSKEEK